MKVIVKFVREDSRIFTLNNERWKIPSNGLEGFGVYNNSISTMDNAVGDGAIVTANRMAQRDRTIMATSRSKQLAETLRGEVTAFFNPKMRYRVYLTYMGRTRWAEGMIEKFNLSTGNIHQPMMLMVTLLFADPYLRSVENFGKDIASMVGCSGFPYLCTAAQGSPTGVFNFASTVNLKNDGDVTAHCKAVLVAHGAVTNPKLIINGHYVRILDEMQEDDTIIIDFTASPPTVRKNGMNYIGHCDRTSEFDQMGLVVGDSTVEYDADNGSNLLSVSIYYNKLYAAM